MGRSRRLHPADAAVVHPAHAAAVDPAGEAAVVHAIAVAVVVVVAGVVPAIAAIVVTPVAVDLQLALDLPAIAGVVDIADLGHAGIAIAPAAGVAVGGVDALLDRRARIAVVIAIIAPAVITVVVAVVVAERPGNRRDSAQHHGAGDDV